MSLGITGQLMISELEVKGVKGGSICIIGVTPETMVMQFRLLTVQNPYTMGYVGMAEAVAAIRNYNTGPPFIDTGVSVITKYQPRRPLKN